MYQIELLAVGYFFVKHLDRLTTGHASYYNIIGDRRFAIQSLMSINKLIRLLPNTLSIDSAAVPALLIKGPIDHKTTFYVNDMLQKIPRNKTKIAVIINSQGGCYAQAHIISKKISRLARRNNAEVWTFAQEWAVNAGFLLLSTGKRVFVDRTSVVGGVQIGQSKILRGRVADYISTITYANQKSYLSEANSQESIDPAKKLQIQAVHRQFENYTRHLIAQSRSAKLAPNVDLNSYYLGEEAVANGLADAVDSFHGVYANLNIASDVRILEKSAAQKVLERLTSYYLTD